MSKVSEVSSGRSNNGQNLKNIISIENFDGNCQALKNKSKQKGKLFLGSNFNAYNRENLGSIPRKTENVLIRDKNNPIKLGFSSNTGRFELKAQKVKYNFPGPGAYMNSKELDTTANSLNTTSRSSKGFGNGFISKVSRFDDLKEFNDKYAPCPTQYKRDKTLSMDASITNSNFYKSLYNTTETKSLKQTVMVPGPGFYNPKKNEFNIEYNKNTFSFKSELDRFAKQADDGKIGPTTYFTNEEEINNKVFAKPSYFFFEETKRQEPIIEKYLDIKKTNPKYEVPGPGAYKPEKCMNIENKALQNLESSKHARCISTGDVVRNKTKYSVCSQDFYETKSGNFDIQKGIVSPFLSKTNHDSKFSGKIVPGPAYYTPNVIPDRLSFNCNVEKKFI